MSSKLISGTLIEAVVELATVGIQRTKVLAKQTGTGAQQTIAHGLGLIPAVTNIFLSESDSGGALAYQTAVPDVTNIYVTATNLKTYNVLIVY